jgi:hypothetical protein
LRTTTVTSGPVTLLLPWGLDLLGAPFHIDDARRGVADGQEGLADAACIVGDSGGRVTDGHREGVDALDLRQLLDREADGGDPVRAQDERVGVHHPQRHVRRPGDGQPHRRRRAGRTGQVDVDRHRLAAPEMPLVEPGGRVEQPPGGQAGAVGAHVGAAGLVGAGAEQAAQPLGRLHRVAVVQHPPVVQDHPAAADPRDQVEGVGDEQDGAAELLELGDLGQALALERLVADGQDLVDQQDVRADVDGHGEPEAHVLPGAVVLDLVVDERLQLGEGDDVVEVALGLAAGQAEDGRVQVDVLAAGQLAVEAGPQLQQGRDPAPDRDRAGGRGEDARQHLEQRRLARAVGADQPHGLAGADLEVDVAQRPERLRAGLAVQQQPLLEAGGPLVVEQEALADPGGLDRRGGH